jgi:hypothetical protein
MSIHVNPPGIVQNGAGIAISLEAMILYAENSEFFNYVRGLVGDWEYYISQTISLDATAYVTVQAGDVSEEQESRCSAYIYGWMPGSSEWNEGSCVAVVFFVCPAVTVSEQPSTVTITVRIETGETIIFYSKRTIPISNETARTADITDNDTL